MGLKQNNEITVKINCDKQHLIDLLLSKGFKLENEQFLEDLYLVPTNLDVNKTSVRDILSQAVLIRSLLESNKVTSKSIRLCYKQKVFGADGSITQQTQFNVDINNSMDAKKFLEAIGYKQILKICEKEYQLTKDGLMFELKDVENGDLLMEVETISNEKYDSIEKIKLYLNEINLPIDDRDYFVKKAEIELQKALCKSKV